MAETVDPLGAAAVYFVDGVEQTVGSARVEMVFEDFGSARTWSGLVNGRPTQLKLSVGEALEYAGMSRHVPAKIGEVIYVLNSALSDVDFVVMVFYEGSRAICVRVSPQTFLGAFKRAASVTGVIVSTIAPEHDRKPPKALESKFPNLKVEYRSVSENTPGSVKATVPRIVVIVGAGGAAVPALVGSMSGKMAFGVPQVQQGTGAPPAAPVSIQPASPLQSTSPQPTPAPKTVVPLSSYKTLLVDSVYETVAAPATFASSMLGAAWAGINERYGNGRYEIGGGGLTVPLKTVPVPLIEVVYVVGNAGSAYIATVILVFNDVGRYIAVN